MDIPLVDFDGWWGAAYLAVVVLGFVSAYDAMMKARTPQGATAWVIALSAIPLFSLPFYWLFGRSKFEDYVDSLRELREQLGSKEERWKAQLDAYAVPPSDARGEQQAFDRLSTAPFTRGNAADLLIDGQETFDAIFEGMKKAERYLLVQFYIVHDDELGKRFHEALVEAARRGVRVYFLYDGIGSHKLPRAYKKSLEEAGVQVKAFGHERSGLKQFRLHFRNHRKMVVVDGVSAYVGGLNVGDEYMGRDPDIGPWRDTHLCLRGPAVIGVQASFLQDWFWATEEEIEMDWEPDPSDEDRNALVLASGPADSLETCQLLFTHAIESAEKRIWIATPYFVPDKGVLSALQLAALRGVDVRILMPRESDSALFKFVPYAYLQDVEEAGVTILLYEEGFMHQKAFVVDDDFAAVGTANFDNRSFRLNFEMTVLFCDERFAGEVAEMLERDFEKSTEISRADIEDKPWWFDSAVQATRLLAPVL